MRTQALLYSLLILKLPRLKCCKSHLESALRGGVQAYVNSLPQVPGHVIPAGLVRVPYAGVCSCLSNIGGCYIDAARPPGPTFTCKCVQKKEFFSGKILACFGIGYKLALGEEHTGGGHDRDQCSNGAKEGLFIGNCGGYFESFSEAAWDKVSTDVTIRLFSPSSLKSSLECDIWEQGEDITCKLSNSTGPVVHIPSGFNPALPVKIVIHGFADDIKLRSEAVPRYMDKFKGEVNVILVNWAPLARVLHFGFDNLDNSFYYRAARNSVIVGEYLGRCLAATTVQTGLQGRNIHVIGHSLGGQMLGTLGRSYTQWVEDLGRSKSWLLEKLEKKKAKIRWVLDMLGWSGEDKKIGRLTALDPAGPGFVDGDVHADPRLHEVRLQKDAASFVDVIHSNAGAKPVLLNFPNPLAMRLGDYGPNGHMDFYPDGGDLQEGCNPASANALLKIGCSHERAYQYFVDSIKDTPGNCTMYGWYKGYKVCMGELAQAEWEYWDHSIENQIEVESKGWYENHETGTLQDLKNATRFACKALLSVYREYVDPVMCRDAWPSCLLSTGRKRRGAIASSNDRGQDALLDVSPGHLSLLAQVYQAQKRMEGVRDVLISMKLFSNETNSTS